jgi:lysophospholipase L1-like esterase
MSKVVWLGDSVTKGTSYGGVTTADTFAYKIGIANGYAAADVINAGVGSDTSSGMLSRLNSDVISLAPSVCIVQCGLNDWVTGVSVSTYRSNLASIFSQLKSNNIKPVFLSKMQRGSTSDFAGQKSYLEAAENECASQGMNVIDLFREECASYLYLSSSSFYANYVDAVHLTVTGHAFVANLAARAKFNGWFT